MTKIMKNYLFIIASLPILFITSCSTQLRGISETSRITFFNFGKYEEEGFKISPYSWDGNDFTWIGEFSLEFQPEIIIKKYETNNRSEYYSPNYNINNEPTTVEVPMQKQLDVDYMLDIFVDAAKRRGADAAINFRIETEYHDVNLSAEGNKQYIMPARIYIMTAYLIKR